MVITAVEHGHPYIDLLEGPCCIQTTESPADDDHVQLRQSSPRYHEPWPAFCTSDGMSMGRRLTRYGGARLSRRLRRSIPLVGTVLAVATVAATIRRKGVISGSLDTGLNAMPVVGLVKNAFEIWRGRDFFPDRFPIDPHAGNGSAPVRRVAPGRTP